MQEMIDIALLVAQRLTSANIPYMISGSVAASFYAVPRMTNDVDIVVQLYKKDKEQLLRLFSSDFYISSDSIDDAFAGVGMFNIIHNASVSKCDMILLKDDAFSRSAFSRSLVIEFEGTPLKVISPEDLIIQKLLWKRETGSELQWIDIQRLIESKKESLDKEYLFQWGRELGLSNALKEIL